MRTVMECGSIQDGQGAKQVAEPNTVITSNRPSRHEQDALSSPRDNAATPACKTRHMPARLKLVRRLFPFNVGVAGMLARRDNLAR